MFHIIERPSQPTAAIAASCCRSQMRAIVEAFCHRFGAILIKWLIRISTERWPLKCTVSVAMKNRSHKTYFVLKHYISLWTQELLSIHSDRSYSSWNMSKISFVYTSLACHKIGTLTFNLGFFFGSYQHLQVTPLFQTNDSAVSSSYNKEAPNTTCW